VNIRSQVQDRQKRGGWGGPSRPTFVEKFVITERVHSLISSGGSRIFERGVQVDYGNSMDCFIMAGEYVYAEAAKSAPIHAEHRNVRPEITSASFSGLIQRALVRRSSKLLHLFHHPCGADSFLLLMACQTYYNFTVTMPTNFLPHCISN